MPKLQPHYLPKEGDKITVTIPNERTRCEIVSVVTDEACIAQLLGFTTNVKEHGLKKGDRIACRFQRGPMNEVQWTYVPHAQMEAEIEERNARWAEQNREPLNDEPEAEPEPEHVAPPAEVVAAVAVKKPKAKRGGKHAVGTRI